MVKLQDKVKFIDDMEKSYTGIVVKYIRNGIVDIEVKRKIGFESQIFVNVPREIKDQKNKPKPRYTELSTKKETPKKKKE